MTVEFEYYGDISWLTSKERKALAKELKECTRPRNWDCFNFYSKTFYVSGAYDDEDGYADDAHDMELVLNSYDVDWQGGAKIYDEYGEESWDALAGYHDI